MAIPIQCAGCGAKFQAPDKLAGKQVKCPKCSVAIAVAEQPQQAGGREATAEQETPLIPATCRCGKQLRVKAELAGRCVKCPACGQVVTVPKPLASKAIPVTCQCGKQYQAKAELAGKSLNCPACGQVVVVPQPGSPDGGLDLGGLGDFSAPMTTSDPLAMGGGPGLPAYGAPSKPQKKANVWTIVAISAGGGLAALIGLIGLFLWMSGGGDVAESKTDTVGIASEPAVVDDASASKPSTPRVAQGGRTTRSSSGTKIRVSKETTYFTEPLRPDGRVDYKAALNRQASAGVTTENNAAALLAHVLGPNIFSEPLRKQFYSELGIPVPQQTGRYFLSMSKFAQQVAGQNSRTYRDDLYKQQQQQGGQQPWSRAEFPKLAAWLDVNEQPLTAVLEATRRPSYYFPLIVTADRDSESLLIAALLPLPQESRSFARALSARAMLAVEEGRMEDALEDLLALHRLARLIAKGHTLVEGLVGIAIESIACRSGEAMLQSGRLSDAQLLEYQQALAGLAPIWSAAERINLTERVIVLEAATLVAHQGVDGMKFISAISGGSSRGPSPPGFAEVLRDLDWNRVLQTINHEFDRQYSALSKTDYSERRSAIDDYIEHLEQVKASAKRVVAIPTLGKADLQQASQVIADVLISLLVPASQASRTAEDRGVTELELLRVAVALERFHKANSRFPGGLNELPPVDGRDLALDLFTDKPFLYQRTDSGYLLYSPGPNQRDDRGQTVRSQPPGDDIAVRMNLKQ